MPRFGNLSEIILGEDDGVFLLGGVQRGIADVEQVGAEREMRSVFLQDAEGQQARALRAMNAFAEVGGSEFLPVDGELGRGRSFLSPGARRWEKSDGGNP